MSIQEKERYLEDPEIGKKNLVWYTNFSYLWCLPVLRKTDIDFFPWEKYCTEDQKIFFFIVENNEVNKHLSPTQGSPKSKRK